MTAVWIDDEPIPYTITVAGWRAVSASLTVREAGRALGLSEAQVSRLAKRGDVACGVRPGSADARALERARADGTATVWMADRLAVQLLRLTIWDLWPSA